MQGLKVFWKQYNHLHPVGFLLVTFFTRSQDSHHDTEKLQNYIYTHLLFKKSSILAKTQAYLLTVELQLKYVTPGLKSQKLKDCLTWSARTLLLSKTLYYIIITS